MKNKAIYRYLDYDKNILYIGKQERKEENLIRHKEHMFKKSDNLFGKTEMNMALFLQIARVDPIIDLELLEQFLINKYRPELNVVHSKEETTKIFSLLDCEALEAAEHKLFWYNFMIDDEEVDNFDFTSELQVKDTLKNFLWHWEQRRTFLPGSNGFYRVLEVPNYIFEYNENEKRMWAYDFDLENNEIEVYKKHPFYILKQNDLDVEKCKRFLNEKAVLCIYTQKKEYQFCDNMEELCAIMAKIDLSMQFTVKFAQKVLSSKNPTYLLNNFKDYEKLLAKKEISFLTKNGKWFFYYDSLKSRITFYRNPKTIDILEEKDEFSKLRYFINENQNLIFEKREKGWLEAKNSIINPNKKEEQYILYSPSQNDFNIQIMLYYYFHDRKTGMPYYPEDYKIKSKNLKYAQEYNLKEIRETTKFINFCSLARTYLNLYLKKVTPLLENVEETSSFEKNLSPIALAKMEKEELKEIHENFSRIAKTIQRLNFKDEKGKKRSLTEISVWMRKNIIYYGKKYNGKVMILNLVDFIDFLNDLEKPFYLYNKPFLSTHNSLRSII